MDYISTWYRLETCFSWETESNQSNTKRLHGQKNNSQAFRIRCEYIVSSVGLYRQTLWIRKFRYRHEKRSFRYKALKTFIISIIIVFRDHIVSYQLILIIWISILSSLSIRYILCLMYVTSTYDLFCLWFAYVRRLSNQKNVNHNILRFFPHDSVFFFEFDPSTSESRRTFVYDQQILNK